MKYLKSAACTIATNDGLLKSLWLHESKTAHAHSSAYLKREPFCFQNTQLNQVTVCDLCLTCQFSRFPMNRYVRQSGQLRFR
jgi:hypothetical protein